MTGQVTLFKNYHGNVHVALKSGRTVAFVSGKFFTTEAALEAELQAAAQTGEFGIYVDTTEAAIDPDAATPMDQLKKKLREELIAELKAGGQLVDAGVSLQRPLQLQTSNSVTGQTELTDEQKALADKQKAIIDGTDDGAGNTNTNQTTETLVPPTEGMTPAEIALAKLKAGK